MKNTTVIMEIVTATIRNLQGRGERFMPGAKTRGCRAMLRAARNHRSRKEIVAALHDALWADRIIA